VTKRHVYQPTAESRLRGEIGTEMRTIGLGDAVLRDHVLLRLSEDNYFSMTEITVRLPRPVQVPVHGEVHLLCLLRGKVGFGSSREPSVGGHGL
jgi:hypothetical protein